MTTVFTGDQADAIPNESVARTRTLLVPAKFHLWIAEAVVPDGTEAVVVVVPSPQSKVRVTASPSGSVAEALKVWFTFFFPVAGPVGAAGVFGAWFEIVTEVVADQAEVAPKASAARTLTA